MTNCSLLLARRTADGESRRVKGSGFDEIAFFPCTDEQRDEIEAWEERRLSPEEFEARVRAPWTG